MRLLVHCLQCGTQHVRLAVVSSTSQYTPSDPQRIGDREMKTSERESARHQPWNGRAARELTETELDAVNGGYGNVWMACYLTVRRTVPSAIGV
jgi:hypothetical protein